MRQIFNYLCTQIYSKILTAVLQLFNDIFYSKHVHCYALVSPQYQYTLDNLIHIQNLQNFKTLTTKLKQDSLYINIQCSINALIVYYIFYKTGFSFSQQEGQQTNINRIGNSRATEKEYDLLKTKVNGYCYKTKVYCKQGQSEKN